MVLRNKTVCSFIILKDILIQIEFSIKNSSYFNRYLINKWLLLPLSLMRLNMSSSIYLYCLSREAWSKSC